MEVGLLVNETTEGVLELNSLRMDAPKSADAACSGARFRRSVVACNRGPRILNREALMKIEDDGARRECQNGLPNGAPKVAISSRVRAKTNSVQ